MTAEANIRAQFEALFGQGSLPRTACSGSFRNALRPLLDSGVVVEERSGAGRRLAVRNAAALSEYIRSRFPNAPVPCGMPNRVAALARFRDSKALPGDTPDIICLRAWSDSDLRHDGQAVPTATATRAHGAFSFVLTQPYRYAVCAPCALVESPAVLLGFERLGLSATVPLAVYAGGRVSSRVLEWLANQITPGFRLVHLPDYDPVGLSEFVRVRTALGERATLHVPDDLAVQFARFGKPKLLRRLASQALLPGLRASSFPEIRVVLDLIERHNAGLEQEALLVSVSSGPKSRI